MDTVFLRRRRLELGLAQCELAREINLSVASLNRIERGLTAARLSTLRRLAERLEVPVHQLYAEKLDTLAGISDVADAA